MRIHSKLIVTLLAAAVSSPLLLAQNAAPPPVPPNAGMQARRPMHPHWGSGPGEHNWRGMGWRARHHHEFMLAHLVSRPSFRERIGITPEQAQKIRTETLKFRENQIRSHADLKVKHLELKNLLSADAPDRHAIDQKLQEISAVRLTQEEAAIDFHLDMRSALTPDQKQKLRQMQEDFFHHRGFGPGGPGGPADAQHSSGADGL